MKKTTRLAALVMGAVLPFVLVACNDSKAYGSQCAYVIGNGSGDSHQIKAILHPGDTVPNKGDDIDEFIPCNARNFIITNQSNTGDRYTPSLGRTNESPSYPAGLPVKAYLRMFWTLNQSNDALKAFQPFCEKYGCYTRNGDKVTGNANYSSPGWNGMLRENHSLVIDKVFAEAINTFPPSIWKTQADWPKVAEKMSELFDKEMRASDGANVDFFCGSWFRSGDRTETCTPVRFVIDSIAPQDDQVANIDQQTALAQSQKALNDAQANATAKRYGPLANYFNGLQDTIKACKDAGQSCTIVIGNLPTGVNVPTGAGK